jgi:hypothetical protein
MIKFLKSLEKDCNLHLKMMETLYLRKEKDDINESKINRTKVMIADAYLMYSHVKHISRNINSIKERTISELTGNYFNDYIKEYVGTDIEEEYNRHTIYKDILFYWDDESWVEHPFMLTEDIKVFIDMNSELNNKLSEGFNIFFPGVKTYKSDGKGNMHETNLTEIQMTESLKAGAKMNYCDEFNKNLLKIKEIAEKRGNLGTIIELIGE